MNLPLGGWLFSDQGPCFCRLGGLEVWRTGEEYLGLGGGSFSCIRLIIPLAGAKTCRSCNSQGRYGIIRAFSGESLMQDIYET